MSEIEPLTQQRTVTAAGTPERIKEAPEQTHAKVVSIVVTALLSNTGNIYITREFEVLAITTSGDILAPGDTWEVDLTMFKDAFLDLSHVWIDADVSGEGISYTAVEAVDVP